MKLTEPQYSIVHLPPGRPLGQSRLSALACRCRDSAAHHASSPASTVLPATEVSLGAWHPLQGVPLPCCHCGGPTVLNSVNSQFPPAFGKVLSPEPSTKMRATHTRGFTVGEPLWDEVQCRSAQGPRVLAPLRC